MEVIMNNEVIYYGMKVTQLESLIALNFLNKHIKNDIDNANEVIAALSNAGIEIERCTEKSQIVTEKYTLAENCDSLAWTIDFLNKYVKGDESKAEMTNEALEVIGIETRVCSHCNDLMIEGYVIEGGDSWYCTKNNGEIDKCLEKEMDRKEFEELFDDGNGDSYWTEWR